MQTRIGANSVVCANARQRLRNWILNGKEFVTHTRFWAAFFRSSMPRASLSLARTSRRVPAARPLRATTAQWPLSPTWTSAR
jgi:hypothetical protein